MSSLIACSANITQGTVVDNVPWRVEPRPLGIVMSNPCDIEWDKASFILIASLIPAKETIHLSKSFQDKVSSANTQKELKSKTWESLNKMIETYVFNSNITRYFFIDPTDILTAPLFFVDFQHLITVPIDYTDGLEKVAQLPNPHVEKMIMHFASYVSRIGTGRFSSEKTQNFVDMLAHPYAMNKCNP